MTETGSTLAPGRSAAESDGPLAPSDMSKNSFVRRYMYSSPVIMGAVLVALLVAFSVARPAAFPTFANAKNILVAGSYLMVMATGTTFVMVAGGIDLSIGSVLVFAGLCSAKVMGSIGGNSPVTVIIGVIVGIAAGVLWGLINGFAVTKLRVPALITTLGTLGAALGAADLITNGQDLSNIPHKLVAIGTDEFLGFSWLIWITAAVVLLGGLILGFTRFGRHTYVIGSNIEAARRAGINVDRHQMRLYAMSGGLAGLAGVLSLAEFASTTLGGHTNDVLEVITGVVLGGTSLYGGSGLIVGTAVGIFIPTVLTNGFTVLNVQPFWQQVAVGFTLIGAVYVDQLKRKQREQGI